MYKVFVNDKPLFLTNEVAKETDFQLFLLESIDIDEMSARNLASVASSGPRGAALVHLSAGKGSLSLVKNDCLYLSRNFSINYQLH